MNCHDNDVERYLKLLTLLDLEEISKLVSEHMAAPEKRLGQKRLAFEVVKIIHGEQDAKMSENITEFLFGDSDKIEMLM